MSDVYDFDYEAFLDDYVSVPGAPDEMTYRSWFGELLIDMMLDYRFSHKTLNVRKEGWKPYVAKDLSKYNPEIYKNGQVDWSEFDLTITNVILVLFDNDPLEYLFPKNYDQHH